jgi:hypothetical protein
VRPDDITRAVLAREDVSKYLRGVAGGSDADARGRIEAYLDELRTTQRYRFYRALQHPLYPILRKVRRIAEHVDRAAEATRSGCCTVMRPAPSRSGGTARTRSTS